MALVEDMLEGNIGTGLAVGIGAAVVGPILAPIIGGVLRPVAKAVIKGGILAYDMGREGVGRLNEMTGDIVAEARSELNAAQTEPTTRGRSKSSAAEGSAAS